MESEFDHFVLTRFNVRVGLGTPGLQRGWLSRRIELFERYCLPAVGSQDCQAFRWLVFVDAETPLEQKRTIESLLGPDAPVYVEGELTVRTIQEAVAQRRTPGRQYVITTRLDNDDAVSRTFIGRIQGRFARQPLAFVNLAAGFELADRRVYWRSDPSNPFISLIEECATGLPRTAMICEHEKAGELAPIIQVRREPAWLQVVHDQNIVNRRRGIRVSADRLKKGFALDLELRDGPLSLRLEQLTTACGLLLRTVSSKRKLKKLLRLVAR